MVIIYILINNKKLGNNCISKNFKILEKKLTKNKLSGKCREKHKEKTSKDL